MAYNLKETLNKEERLSPGHRMCAGCGATIAVRNVLRGLHDGDEAVITCATSCLEVSSFMYPYTAWKDSFIHDAFENAGATCSGVEAAYRALSKKGKVKNTHKFIAFGGDGGTYDIGFQSLSGAMERNHDMVLLPHRFMRILPPPRWEVTAKEKPKTVKIWRRLLPPTIFLMWRRRPLSKISRIFM